MTTAKQGEYTPGPWIAVTGNLVRGPHGEPIASTVGFAYPQDPHHAANAALIARAPDLLAENERLREALRAIARECQDRTDGADECRARDTVLYDLCRMAEQALAGKGE